MNFYCDFWSRAELLTVAIILIISDSLGKHKGCVMCDRPLRDDVKNENQEAKRTRWPPRHLFFSEG